jgi:hypothetical protein
VRRTQASSPASVLMVNTPLSPSQRPLRASLTVSVSILMGAVLQKPYRGFSRLVFDLPLQLQHRRSRRGDSSGVRWLPWGRWCASNHRDHSMSGEVLTSQAELDLTALEGVLGEPGLRTTRCAARPLQHLRGHRMVLGMATRTSGCGGVQAPRRIEQDGELYHKEETRSDSGVR